MTRKTTIGVILAFAVALAALLLPAAAQARQGCTEFRAIGQATAPSPYDYVEGLDTWGGAVYGSLGGEPLSGNFSGNDGDTTGHGVTGMGTNGTYVFYFGPVVGSFTMDVSHAAWPAPPGKVALLEYRGTAKIVKGTGRFENAAGNLEWSGPAIIIPSLEHAYFNAEIKGFICGVQPAP